MVTRERYDGGPAYRCDVCGFHFREQEMAAECEAFCREHGSCSSDITAAAIERS